MYLYMYSKSTNQFGLNIIILLYMIQSLDILQCSQTGVFVMQVKHEVRDSISYVNSMLSTALFDVDVDCPCLTRNSDICVHFCTTIPALSARPQSFSVHYNFGLLKRAIKTGKVRCHL